MQKYKRIQIFKRNVCVVQNVISYLFVRMQESIIKSIPASKNNSDAVRYAEHIVRKNLVKILLIISLTQQEKGSFH